MKKIFRYFLLLLVLFALYTGMASAQWSYPIAIIALISLFFIATFSRNRSKRVDNNQAGSSVLAGSAAANVSSGSDCGGDGGC